MILKSFRLVLFIANNFEWKLLILILIAHACYYCVSYAHLLEPNLRYQLGTQTDIFHWPTDASSPNCSNPSLARNPHQLHAQICTKFPLCTTLSLNIASICLIIFTN